MSNAFRILKPIQKSSKRVWVFHNTGANAVAKNQMRLAYEDKRDLYCSCDRVYSHHMNDTHIGHHLHQMYKTDIHRDIMILYFNLFQSRWGSQCSACVDIAIISSHITSPPPWVFIGRMCSNQYQRTTSPRNYMIIAMPAWSIQHGWFPNETHTWLISDQYDLYTAFLNNTVLFT